MAVDVPSLESVRAVGMKEKAPGRTCEWNRNTVDFQGQDAAQCMERCFNAAVGKALRRDPHFWQREVF